MEEQRKDTWEKKEQEAIEQIRQSAEDIPVPDALSPENIRKKLEEQNKKESKTVQGRFGAWRKYVYRTVEVAAAVVVVFAAGHQIGVMNTRRTMQQENVGTQSAAENADAQSAAEDADTRSAAENAGALSAAENADAQSAAEDAGTQNTALKENAGTQSAVSQADGETQAETTQQAQKQTEAAPPFETLMTELVVEPGSKAVKIADVKDVVDAADADSASTAEADGTPAAEADSASAAEADIAPIAKTDSAPAAGADRASTAEMDAAPIAKADGAPAAGADSAPTAEENSTSVTEAENVPEGIAPIGSVEALYDRLVEYQKENYMGGSYARNDYGVMAIQELADEAVAEDGAVNMTAASSAKGGGAGDYSSTNLRQIGVDEGDIIKTDGKYIYILKRNSSVKIISADGEQMALIQSLVPEDLSVSVRDMYISGSVMNIITSGSKTSMAEEETDVFVTKDYDYAQVWTYDIADPAQPKLLGTTEQEGYYHSSRKVGDYIYLFTQFTPVISETLKKDDIMPLVNGVAMEATDIYVPESLQSTSYLVIGSMDVQQPSHMLSHKAVVSGVENFYVSGESIFICNRSWKDGSDFTDIMKFSYKDGDIRGVGVCSLEGYLNDTFSLDEYNGYLRVVATNWNSGDEVNALYVYNDKMNLVGRIDDIAPDETIRSARFLGDIGYFVTFRQTDPLFSVDLSDPENPKILGELKVNGFSSYLHFFGENKLLGIGYDADAQTGMTTGIKLSMFDITDPANVKEIKRYIIKDANYCPGLSNYKAILADPEKNLLGFVCDNNYLVFSYDEQEGFQNKLTYNMSAGTQNNGYGYWYEYEDVRGLYIADTFYLADMDEVRAFDMADGFTQGAKLEL